VKIVLGIGNPGREYASTRHNVGWRVADGVAALLSPAAEFRRKRRFKGLLGEGVAHGPGGDERVLLVKPETFVNLSGECARTVADYYRVEAASLLVVADDVNLPLAQIRCRRGGSSGGHKGLESVIRHLGTEAFPRLRVGVGRPRVASGSGDARRGGGEAADSREGGLTGHVLGAFSKEEAPLARRAEERAAEAVMAWVRDGIEVCMDRYNVRQTGTADERR
jgi:PTH1 family peptidyl-tRNA hydrolase